MTDLTKQTPFELINQIIEIQAEYNDLFKHPGKYLFNDLHDWSKNRKPLMEDCMEELHWHLNPETPDAQRAHDFALEDANQATFDYTHATNGYYAGVGVK